MRSWIVRSGVSQALVGKSRPQLHYFHILLTYFLMMCVKTELFLNDDLFPSEKGRFRDKAGLDDAHILNDSNCNIQSSNTSYLRELLYWICFKALALAFSEKLLPEGGWSYKREPFF